MGFSINVDWSSMSDDWDNKGRSLIEENCKHKAEDSNETNMRYSGYCEKCGHSEDSCQPMMNFAYPLETKPDDEKIIKVCEQTNCTVMYNNEEDIYYLALCGGGMDLSQDIALAYNILEKWIPFELALQVITQIDFSQSGKRYRQTMRACRDSLKNNVGHARTQIAKIEDNIKESLAKDREEVKK